MDWGNFSTFATGFEPRKFIGQNEVVDGSAAGLLWTGTSDNLLNTNKLKPPTMDNTFNMRESVRDVKRALERERECLMERAGWLNGLGQIMETVDDIVRENEALKEENEELRERVAELCKACTPTGPVAFYNYGTYNEVRGMRADG